MLCYYEDSEGDKNYLSEDEDLKDALKYKNDKKMNKLRCKVIRKDGRQIVGKVK